MCEVCNRKGIVFTVEINGKQAKACSGCVLSHKLTGWSK